MGTKVHQVMSGSPRCVTPETPVSEAAQLMESEDIGSLPILDGELLAGVVTDRDIVIRAIAKGKTREVCRCARLRAELVTVHADDDLSEALQADGNAAGATSSCRRREQQARWRPGTGGCRGGAKEKAVGELVEEISKSPTGPRL